MVVGMVWEERGGCFSRCHMNKWAIMQKESASPNDPKGSVKTL